MSLAQFITGKDVEKLDHNSLRKVLNTLLTVEASVGHVPLTAVHLTTHDTDAEGGVDARLSWPAETIHDIIPPGEVVLQYKSGKLSLKKLAKEFKKPGVQTVLKAHGSYLLMLAQDTNAKRDEELKAELAKLCRSRNIPRRRCAIFNGSAIAAWVCRHLAVMIMPEFGKTLPPFVTVAEWRRRREFSNPWVSDVGAGEKEH